jgi:hypothetical protein
MGSCFVVDTNVLIHLDYFNQKIFPSLWNNLDEMIQEGKFFSVSEVSLELNKIDDRISAYWNVIGNTHEFFMDPPEEVLACLPYLEPFETFQNYGKEKKLWADPYLISYGMAKNATVITQETLNKHPERKIPFVCNEMGVDCMNLDEFMIHHKWEW